MNCITFWNRICVLCTNMRYLSLILLFLLLLSNVAQAQHAAFDEVTPTQKDAKVKVQMYPNPSTDYLHVKLDGVKAEDLKFSVHNIIGNEIPTEIEYIGTDEVRLRVKELTTGYYLLALRDEHSSFKGTYKFLKR